MRKRQCTSGSRRWRPSRRGFVVIVITVIVLAMFGGMPAAYLQVVVAAMSALIAAQGRGRTLQVSRARHGSA